MKEAFVRPSSPDRKSEKKGGAKPIGEIKDIFKLAGEFKEMVTQMAFEKFDFHQWFRYVRGLCVFLPFRSCECACR